jgi:hypothetical protein
MTIVIHFHQSRYHTFKTYYTRYVRVYLCSEFPNLVSYARFVPLMRWVLAPLCAYLVCCYGRCSGLSFIDPHRLRYATTGTSASTRSSTGWRSAGAIRQLGSSASSWISWSTSSLG